jgi:hypothetical protein
VLSTPDKSSSLRRATMPPSNQNIPYGYCQCGYGKDIKLGRFVSKDDAVAARISAEQKYHGEYSSSNRNKLLEGGN